MGRLCERPGCSEPAAVAYGMRPEDLVFWLDALAHTDDLSSGVLCLRHADAMVVPRNWTLDDHRDPDLHLFRPPSESGGRRRGSRRSPRARSDSEQLELGVEADLTDEAGNDADDHAGNDAGNDAGNEADAATDASTESDPTTETWTPDFDDADDLDGLLSAQSPLLARAFRGDDRPKD